MYQNYPFYGYPPPVIIPPGQQRPLTPEEFERGMKFVHRQREREERNKERIERNKKKAKQEESDRAAAVRARTFNTLEWYILGILSYPFWAPVYRVMMSHMGFQ